MSLGDPATAPRLPARRDEAGCDPQSLRRLVDAHDPADERERVSKERILAELARLVRPCDRAADPVHVTASAIVAGPRGTVLHRHRLLGRWLQPGGHVDAGEGPSAAAVREVREETGLATVHPGGRPVVVHLDAHGAANGHVHLDLRFLLLAAGTRFRPLPGESREVSWFTWPEAAALADASLSGALRAARRVLGLVTGPDGDA